MRASAARATGAILVAVTLGGCSTIRNFFDPSNVDYRSAQRGPGLDVPPDLVGPKANDRYVVPERGAGQTFSDYSRERRSADREAPVGPAVLPPREGARLMHDGARYWLVVDQPPDQVWPQVLDFWSAQGIGLRSDSPELGVMDTTWVPRRERPETSGLRGVLSKALGSSYTTSMEDAYRTRLDRTPEGKTEITIAHRALEEVVNSRLMDSTIWQPAPTRPELEVEMLRRMMMRIGRVDEPASRQAAAEVLAPQRPERAAVYTEAGSLSGLRLTEGFDRAWRDVGLAIDRIGFTVEDRDRSKGIYFVRYVDLDRRDPRQGALSRLFTGERKDLSGQRYQIRVEGDPAASRVLVRNEGGQTPASDLDVRVANRIVALLHERMR